MGNETKKILTLSYLVSAALTWLVAGILLDTFSATFGFVARLVSSDVFRHGVPVGLGAILFFFLQFNRKVNVWGDEVVSEIRKVVWPSQRDTSGMTVVVCVFLIFTGTLIGVFDFLSGYVVNLFIAS
jgi:preprotein translocase subunit SecE